MNKIMFKIKNIKDSATFRKFVFNNLKKFMRSANMLKLIVKEVYLLPLYSYYLLSLSLFLINILFVFI